MPLSDYKKKDDKKKKPKFKIVPKKKKEEPKKKPKLKIVPKKKVEEKKKAPPKKKMKLKVVPRKNKEELRKALESNKKLGASFNFDDYRKDYMNNQPAAKTEKQMEKLSAKADKEVFNQIFKYYSDKGTLSGFKLKYGATAEKKKNKR